jgi:hypothetical protein
LEKPLARDITVAVSNSQDFYWAIAAGIILPYCAAAMIRWRRRSQELRAPVPKRTNTYLALRSQVLNSGRPQASPLTSGQPSDPWAVVMEWAVPSGTATVVAVSDGTASIYYSGGGGSIGGGYARQSIRDGALYAVSIAKRFLDHMQVTESFSLPEPDGVAFYILTERGVFAAKASVELLSTNRHPLSELGNAMQAIITQYRIMESSSN